MSSDLAASIVTAPAGAALLAALEFEARRRADPSGARGPRPLDGVDPDAIERAVSHVGRMADRELLALAVESAERTAGPWSSDAPQATARVLRDAPQRAVLADAVVARLEERLAAPLDRDHQVWWWSNHPFDDEARQWWGRLGRTPRRPIQAWVTATHDGLWTSTQAGDTLAAHQVSAWEIFPGPVTCWTLTVGASARIFEVRAPDDWERLVRSAPLARDRRPNTSWEFPGMDPHNTYEVQPLVQLPNQRAMRPRETFRYFVEPKWDVVAENWDAVHLTWAGFLTTEGLVIDLDDGDVTMLRNWNSERTLWLNPVLHNPRPAPGPDLLGDLSGIIGLDVATSSHRGKQDLRWLEHKLGD